MPNGAILLTDIINMFFFVFLIYDWFKDIILYQINSEMAYGDIHNIGGNLCQWKLVTKFWKYFFRFWKLKKK